VADTRRDEIVSTVRSSGVIAIAIGVMNVATYAFTMIAARMLGPTTYGAMAALMATLLVFGVIQLGVQSTTARRVASEPEHLHEIERSVMAVTYRIALVLGVALALLSPLLMVVLRLDHLSAALLVAVAAVPLTITGGQAGVLQGERRWGELSLIYLTMGLTRLGLGVGFIAWRPTELMAMVGVATGLALTALLGLYVLRGPRAAGPVSDRHTSRAILAESLLNSFALLAFFALSNVDVIIARNILPAEEAGLYAAGLILTKAVLFLPQFVVIVSYPTFTSTSHRRRALGISLGTTAALGLCATLAASVLPSLALVFVGGDAFSDIQPHLWYFAVAGTALAMLQLLLFSELARQGHSATWFIWGALVLLCVTAPLTADTVTELVLLVVTIDVALCLTLVTMALRHSPRDATEEVADPVPGPTPGLPGPAA
jgi:O-antigen/teichoic acid export membrane protein